MNVNAPSKQEQERARFIEGLLRKHKLDIRYDEAGNLIATRKGDRFAGYDPMATFLPTNMASAPRDLVLS